MPGGRTSGKHSGKPIRQLLFSKLYNIREPRPRLRGASNHSAQQHGGSNAGNNHGPHFTRDIGGGSQAGGDGQRYGLTTAETKSMRLHIAGFQSQVMGLEQRVTKLETDITSSLDRDQELIYLCSKLIALEDKSRRDNVRFFGFPENIEGADIHSYLRETLPKLTGLTFDPPLEFQRLHRLGPKRLDEANRPRPIIACLLQHVQTSQLLQVARAHGPFRMNGQEIRLTADFSKETSEHRKAFLALQPQLHQLEGKYCLFEPLRMWITKNGVSKDFYDPEYLQVFLEGLQTQFMDTAAPAQPQDLSGATQGAPNPPPGETGQPTVDFYLRERDLERLTKSHDNRGQVLQAVVVHMQTTDKQVSLPPEAHCGLT
ncbi:hypothetical protein NDU88_004251 [Pleurodeles waltl]|uniref:Uncharacterized protein n=1 Tax=Pleurodeles waltl TaxID=8319 RepID=A0AAV7RG67_PLEWA|nr:hypothetical protein NDU88_004251 [Pleurodeles waltl]